jgi:hypothetical protein
MDKKYIYVIAGFVALIVVIIFVYNIIGSETEEKKVDNKPAPV